MIRSASRRAITALREQGAPDRRASVATLTTLAEQLYAVADVLVSQPRLRRTLGDPATAPEGRSKLVETLFGGKIGTAALKVSKAAVAQRWSTPWDLTDALEGAGDDALFAAAEKDGQLDQVEDELFRLERVLASDGDLSGLLDELTVPPERRIALLDSLVAGKVTPISLALLHHAIASQRKRSILLAVDDLLQQAAARRERSIARVLSAVPLTAAQERRLAGALEQMYGRTMSIRTALDPSVRGGLIVRVGDEIIDGSIASKFTEARSALAG